MRNPERIDIILELLKELWKKDPDLRLGQIILKASQLGGWKQDDVFFCEDDMLQEGLVKLRGILK